MTKLASDSSVISHWHHPIENFQTSPMEFYACVEQALQPRQIPDYSVSRIDWREGGVLSARREYLRVKRGNLVFDICAAPFGTGFFFSWWLTEVPPSWGLLWAFLIAYVGFVSIGFGMQASNFLVGIFWGIVLYVAALCLLGYLIRRGMTGTNLEAAVLGIPFFGGVYERLFKPPTYYRMDTAIMFQSMVHAAVLDAIDPLLNAKSVRALSELERKPIMRGMYQR